MSCEYDFAFPGLCNRSFRLLKEREWQGGGLNLPQVVVEGGRSDVRNQSW